MADICSEVDITQAVVTSTEIKKLQETGNSSSKLKVQKLLMVDKAFFFCQNTETFTTVGIKEIAIREKT